MSICIRKSQRGHHASHTSTDNDKTAIRPFHVHVPESALIDLRRCIRDTRWPDRETVDDDSQGVQLATMQQLAQYWANDYDWRKIENRLNALPQFVTEIDGLDIHLIHVRSKHDNVMPLIVTHGWPGSIVEQLKIIVHILCCRKISNVRAQQLVAAHTLVSKTARTLMSCQREPIEHSLHGMKIVKASCRDVGIGTRRHFGKRAARAKFQKGNGTGLDATFQARCPLDRLGYLQSQLVHIVFGVQH